MCLFILLCMHLFAPFTHLCIRLYVHSFTHSSTHSFIHLFVLLFFMHAIIHSFIHALISFIRPSMHSCSVASAVFSCCLELQDNAVFCTPLLLCLQA